MMTYQLPYWVLKECSDEFASVVFEVFIRSFQTGTVPTEWLTAVVTPIPKKPPTGLSDYRPTIVTPFLSQLAEKTVVWHWLGLQNS